MANILIIDDDKRSRTVLRMILEDEGHEVEDAPDGEKGISIYKERGADVVITDILMPVKEGLETIMELKQISPSLKIIAISGGGRIRPEGYLMSAISLGADRAFSMPVKRNDLLAATDELIAQTQQALCRAPEIDTFAVTCA